MAHGAPDYHQNVLIMGNDGTNNKQVFVNADGKIINLIQGEYSGSPKTIALDENGKLITLIQGDYSGEPKTVALDENGNMSIYLAGSMPLKAPIFALQAIEDYSCVHSHSCHGYGTSTRDCVSYQSCLCLEIEASQASFVRFNEFANNLSHYNHVYVVIKSLTEDIDADLRIYCSDGAFRTYDLPIKTNWKRIHIDIDDFIEESGIFTRQLALYFQIYFPSMVSGYTIRINDILGSHKEYGNTDQQQAKIASSGAILTELSANYDNEIKKLQTDSSSNLKIDISAQSLSPLVNKPVKEQTRNTHIDLSSVVDDTDIFTISSSSGKIQGGGLRLNYLSSASNVKTAYIQIRIDGTTFAALTFSDMIDFGVSTSELYPIYKVSWDNATKIIIVGLRPGFSCTDEMVLTYRQGSANDDPNIRGEIQYYQS